jgi:hypothetical protein
MVKSKKLGPGFFLILLKLVACSEIYKVRLKKNPDIIVPIKTAPVSRSIIACECAVICWEKVKDNMHIE